jgi:hypothetical protein
MLGVTIGDCVVDKDVGFIVGLDIFVFVRVVSLIIVVGIVVGNGCITLNVFIVGTNVGGIFICKTGALENIAQLIGIMVGCCIVFIVGGTVGAFVGNRLGLAMGLALGILVGLAIGAALGILVGLAIGAALGILVGLAIGAALGILMGLAIGAALGILMGLAFTRLP